MGTGIFASTAGFYIHNHLYSPVALIDYSGSVLERYEYDAYGSPTIWNGDFTVERSSPSYSPFLFTGREVDYLDSGSLKIQYNRNRYYDYYTGRWLTPDPLAIVPNSQASNYFKPDNQYLQGLSLYEYSSSNPILATDPLGLEYIINGTYELDGSDPEEEPFDGSWNTAPWVLKVALRPTLSRLKMTMYGVALAWYGLGWHDASAYLTNYLSNTGAPMNTDYHRMLRDSGDARKFFINRLKVALEAAEDLVDSSEPQPKQMTTKGVTKADPEIEDDMNWELAVHGYDVWERGIVRKHKGRQSCCYTMIWTVHFSDIYNFDSTVAPMYALNWCGLAKYFKSTGKHSIMIKWAKGYRLQHDVKTDIVEGRLKPFPQCQ